MIINIMCDNVILLSTLLWASWLGGSLGGDSQLGKVIEELKTKIANSQVN